MAGSSLLLVDCATSPVSPYEVLTTHDKSDFYTAVSMTGNLLGGRLNHELNAGRVSAKDGKVNYALGVYYYGRKWMFIKPGESLILFVDGEEINVKGQGSQSYRKTLKNGMVSELAKYPVTPQLLKKIASAKQVKVKIFGGDFVAEKYFTKQNFENFRQFVNDYVK
jgi:bifunctional DNA-binding transcriptional regulator/antitoxin component of YhaV-PrlF toxin-antitoxin module